MANPSVGPVAIRVSDAGTTNGEFESGWVLEDSGGVRFGEATGGSAAGPTDFVVARATLSRPLRTGLTSSGAAKYLAGLLAGTQTTPVDVEVRRVGADGNPAGRGLVYRIAVPLEVRVGAFNAASRDALVETFEFVARDLEILDD
jgi:hypothetical protein